MKVPRVIGVIERRILVNFRVAPEALARVLPFPFRPKLIGGSGMAGICWIRLRDLRPRGVPGVLGLTSENAAHRIAVEWEQAGQICEGVYIPRRDTSSRINAMLGGRLFPGSHGHARFDIEEGKGSYSLRLRSDDGLITLSFEGSLHDSLPDSSVFRSMQEASAFFKNGSLGYSPTSDPGRFEGLELRCGRWHLQPLKVGTARSSLFEDERHFPRGGVTFDSAFLMKEIPHEWRAAGELGGLRGEETRVAAPASVRGSADPGRAQLGVRG